MTDLRRVQDALVEVHRADGDDALDLISHVVTGAIDECRWASVVLVDGATPTTVSYRGVEARAMDDAQRRAGAGPGLEAVASSRSCLVADVEAAPWPALAEAARSCGVRSVLAAPFGTDGELRGALTLYGDRSGAFGPDLVEPAEMIAAHAGVAVGNLLRLARAEGLNADLQEALLTRDVIGQAKGILMRSRLVTDEEAFLLLRSASQNRNVKLRDIAAEVARTGELVGDGEGEGQPTA